MYAHKKRMVSFGPIPTYPETMKVYGSRSHIEERNNKLFIWCEEVIPEVTQKGAYAFESWLVSAVPAGKIYRGFVIGHATMGDWIWHVVYCGESRDPYDNLDEVSNPLDVK